MNWQDFDVPTRVAVIATGTAVVALIVPPLFVLSALVAIGFSIVSWRRANARGDSTLAPKVLLLFNMALIALVMAGTIIYAIADR